MESERSTKVDHSNLLEEIVKQAAMDIARIAEPEHDAGWGIYVDVLRPHFARLNYTLANVKEEVRTALGSRVTLEYGDLPTSVRPLIPSHEWDNMKLCEQRDWVIQQLAAVQQLVPDEVERDAIDAAQQFCYSSTVWDRLQRYLSRTKPYLTVVKAAKEEK